MIQMYDSSEEEEGSADNVGTLINILIAVNGSVIDGEYLRYQSTSPHIVRAQTKGRGCAHRRYILVKTECPDNKARV